MSSKEATGIACNMSNLSQRQPGFFITGSDTNVGKTWVATQLIKQLRSRGIALKVRKPIESGCQRLDDAQLFPADGNSLFEANDCQENLQLVTPYRYSAAVAPDRAARLEGERVYLDQLQQAVNADVRRSDFLMVEGAGGFYSPIAQDGLNSDLARRLKLDVIIVVEDRLGAINQSLLVIKAVEGEGLKVHALILNQCKPDGTIELDNWKDLCARTRHPVYRCSFQGQLEELDLFFN